MALVLITHDMGVVYETAEPVIVKYAGQQVEPNGDLLDGRPVQSRLSRLYAYRFPVHRISTDFIPDSPGEQPTYLVIYRKADDRLGFMELNPVTARLLELIGDARFDGVMTRVVRARGDLVHEQLPVLREEHLDAEDADALERLDAE